MTSVSPNVSSGRDKTMIDENPPASSGNDPKSYNPRQWITTSVAVAGALIATGSARGQENIPKSRDAQHGQSASNPGPDNEPIFSVQPDAETQPAGPRHVASERGRMAVLHRREGQ